MKIDTSRMGPFAKVLDAISRRRLIREWNLQGRKFYVCHLAHPNDRVAVAAVAEYFKWAGVAFTVIEFNPTGQRPELLPALGDATLAVIGFNSQLDHSWVGDEKFIALAGKRNIPVIQWVVDHPSLRWPEFELNLDATNVRYVFASDYCEQYFHRYAVAAARTAVVCCPITPLSRIEDMSRAQYLSRKIGCLIPLNLRRLGGTADEMETRIRDLEAPLADAVREAIELARFDLENPLVLHLESALARRQIALSNKTMHVCTSLVEDMTHIWRRRRIFEVAARFPVLIQTDLPPPELAATSIANFKTTPEWTDPAATLARMKSCRAVVSVSLANDVVHDRTGNAVNAGCLAIVEDNVVHRRVFKPGKSALFFRYDDDSLEQCLDLVCNHPERAYDIARRGMKLREKPAFRFAGCHNLLELARP